MFLEYRKELRVIYNNLGALVSHCIVTSIVSLTYRYSDLGSEYLYLLLYSMQHFACANTVRDVEDDILIKSYCNWLIMFVWPSHWTMHSLFITDGEGDYGFCLEVE